MGMTPFIAIISPKDSNTYILAPQCPWDLYAIPGSGAQNPVVPRRPWVRLVVAIAAGVPLQHNPYFYKCRIFPGSSAGLLVAQSRGRIDTQGAQSRRQRRHARRC
jgi:hypothetical protein